MQGAGVRAGNLHFWGYWLRNNELKFCVCCLMTQLYGVGDWCMIKWVWSVGRTILIGRNRSSRREACPSTTLSARNVTETGLESNTGLHGETPATSLRSHCTRPWNLRHLCSGTSGWVWRIETLFKQLSPTMCSCSVFWNTSQTLYKTGVKRNLTLWCDFRS